jgi:hypothetical protein
VQQLREVNNDRLCVAGLWVLDDRSTFCLEKTRDMLTDVLGEREDADSVC